MAKTFLFGLYSSVTVITVILTLFNYATSLKVTVYYESLCYDSIKFIGQQLYPHWTEISPHVDLELIPYGKALHNLRNDKYEFFCQHGASECAGNKYQSCLLAQNLGKNKDVPLVHCIMSGKNPASLIHVTQCARPLQYDIRNLNKCVESEDADKLLAQNGDKTWALTPNLSFVPTIVFDDLFNKTDTDGALIDFVAVVCNKIKTLNNKPEICNGKKLPEIAVFNDFTDDV